MPTKPEFYAGRDKSQIAGALHTEFSNCIVAAKSATDFGILVTSKKAYDFGKMMTQFGKSIYKSGYSAYGGRVKASSTGAITLATSANGNYDVTYTTPGVCPTALTIP